MLTWPLAHGNITPWSFSASLALKLPSGHSKGLGISSSQQLQTTRTQPSCSLIHQHRDPSSLLDTGMLRRGLSPAQPGEAFPGHSLPRKRVHSHRAALGAQEEQEKEDSSPETALKQED